MEFIKGSWRYIRSQLEQLSTNAKWLIGAMLIILVLSLVLILWYAGSPAYVPITAFASQRTPEVVAQLQGAGIRVTTRGGQVLVPTKQQFDAIAVLQSRDLMAPDTAAAFDDLIDSSPVWESNAKFKEKLHIAKLKVLGQIIGKLKGVRSADVVIAKPDRLGFGRNYVRPSASVNVVMEGRKGIDRLMVESIAGLVSGAVAEMTPQDVVVIDANRGRQFKVKSEDDYGPEESLVVIQQREQYYRDKIVEQLRFIKDVIVTVNVHTESIARKDVTAITYSESEPLKETEEVFESRENLKPAGAPGVRANTGAEILSPSVGGSKETREETRTKYGPREVREESRIKHIGQETKQINASIAVPRSHMVFLSAQQGGAAGGGGDNDGDGREGGELEDAFVEAELAKIEALVRPIIQRPDSDGMLQVDMYDDGPMQMAMHAQTAGSAGVAGLLDSRWIRPAGLTLLALMAMAMMFSMVRKATRQPTLPSAEELAGVPPPLSGDEDLIGAAEDTEASMAGVEVAEHDIRARKVAKQISELVKESPEEAASLLNKWMQPEE